MGTTTDTYNNLNEPAENYAEWKKPISKGYILYNSIYNVLKTTTLKKGRRDEWLPEIKDGEGVEYM